MPPALAIFESMNIYHHELSLNLSTLLKKEYRKMILSSWRKNLFKEVCSRNRKSGKAGTSNIYSIGLLIQGERAYSNKQFFVQMNNGRKGVINTTILILRYIES